MSLGHILIGIVTYLVILNAYVVRKECFPYSLEALLRNQHLTALLKVGRTTEWCVISSYDPTRWPQPSQQ